jgi:hypothetical protein
MIEYLNEKKSGKSFSHLSRAVAWQRSIFLEE